MTTKRKIRVHSHTYWVGFLAGALERVTRSETLGEAKKEAQRGLGAISDPYEGLHDIDADTRHRWREVARGEDEDE